MRHTKKMRVLASAMLLASQIGTVSAAPMAQDAQTIVNLIDADNYSGLRAYIIANPHVLEGENVLAETLNLFMSQMNVIDSTGVIRLDASLVRVISEEARIY